MTRTERQILEYTHIKRLFYFPKNQLSIRHWSCQFPIFILFYYQSKNGHKVFPSLKVVTFELLFSPEAMAVAQGRQTPEADSSPKVISFSVFLSQFLLSFVCFCF